MENSMIERVAEAICADGTVPIDLGDARDLARAAIKAMREPTHHMSEVGSFEVRDDATTMQAVREAKDVYMAMIDAAIQG